LTQNTSTKEEEEEEEEEDSTDLVSVAGTSRGK
jgi:hypothetical protein